MKVPLADCRSSAGIFVCHQIHLVVKVPQKNFRQPDFSRLPHDFQTQVLIKAS